MQFSDLKCSKEKKLIFTLKQYNSDIYTCIQEKITNIFHVITSRCYVSCYILFQTCDHDDEDVEIAVDNAAFMDEFFCQACVYIDLFTVCC